MTAQSAQVKSYFAALPGPARKQLEALRGAIRAAAPGAVEAFGYGMPAFALDGKPFLWYGAWKTHASLYPLSRATRETLGEQLASYPTSGKGTIRFPFGQPVPAALVKRIVQMRIAELRSPGRRIQ